MRLLIQRVTKGSVTVDGVTHGAIRNGLVVLLGVGREDTTADADYLLDKLLRLRIFNDEAGKMNRSIEESGGELLVISQFTLYGDCRKGRRPSFDSAAPAELARSLYTYFVDRARASPVKVETGVFQASMLVDLTNDGPVTIFIDSAGKGSKR